MWIVITLWNSLRFEYKFSIVIYCACLFLDSSFVCLGSLLQWDSDSGLPIFAEKKNWMLIEGFYYRDQENWKINNI